MTTSVNKNINDPYIEMDPTEHIKSKYKGPLPDSTLARDLTNYGQPQINTVLSHKGQDQLYHHHKATPKLETVDINRYPKSTKRHGPNKHIKSCRYLSKSEYRN